MKQWYKLWFRDENFQIETVEEVEQIYEMNKYFWRYKSITKQLLD